MSYLILSCLATPDIDTHRSHARIPVRAAQGLQAKCIQCATGKASCSLDFIPRRIPNIRFEAYSGSGVMPAASSQAPAQWTAESPAVSPTEAESEDGLAVALKEIQFLIHTTEMEFGRKIWTLSV